MSGRSPAYVPTTSARVRSTSIVALTVSRSCRPPSRPPTVARRALVRRVGRADQPVVRPRDEEDDLARARGWSARSCSGCVRAARRGARRGSAGSAASRRRTGGPGSAAQTPVASTTAAVGISRSRAGREVRRQERLDRSRLPDRPQAGGADPGDRHAAGGDRGPSHGQRVAGVVLDAVVVEQAAAQPLAAAGSGRARASPPSTAVGASRRRGGRRGCRTASGRRRRTPSRANGIP